MLSPIFKAVLGNRCNACVGCLACPVIINWVAVDCALVLFPS